MKIAIGFPGNLNGHLLYKKLKRHAKFAHIPVSLPRIPLKPWKSAMLTHFGKSPFNSRAY